MVIDGIEKVLWGTVDTYRGETTTRAPDKLMISLIVAPCARFDQRKECFIISSYLFAEYISNEIVRHG
jgi:hypothetical protein